MERIIVADGDAAVRAQVSALLQARGAEVIEAASADELLELAGLGAPNLVLIDIALPEKGAAAAIKSLRGNNCKSPVLLLTANFDGDALAPVTKLGVTEFLVKPIVTNEFQKKVEQVLGAATQASTADTGKPALMLVDDMANVGKVLRDMVPATVEFVHCVDQPSALTACSKRAFHTILLDVEIPRVDCQELLGRLRRMQPEARILALIPRTKENPNKVARQYGFVGHLVKPFDTAQVDELLASFVTVDQFLGLEEEVVRVLPSAKQPQRIDYYMNRLRKIIGDAIDQVAAACYATVVVDLRDMPVVEDKLPRFVLAIEEKATQAGLGLRLVGSVETKAVLGRFMETANVSCYTSVEEAREEGT